MRKLRQLLLPNPKSLVLRKTLAGSVHRICFSPRILCSARPNCRYASTIPAAKFKFGQPLHETHPHLLEQGEVTPGATALEYATRRANLAAKLPEGGIAIVKAASIKYRSGSVFYKFHQDPDFFYLTGFNEPEAVAVIEKTGPGREHVFHLYVRPKDAQAEMWEGARSGPQAATDVFNADKAGDVTKLHKLLPAVISRAEEVFVDLPNDRDAGNGTTKALLELLSSKEGHTNLLHKGESRKLRSLMDELRVIKSDTEVENMRIAGKASGRAITKTMRLKYATEKAVASFLEYSIRKHGCEGLAYIPVVASGSNALSIHYTQNNDVLEPGKLVLVDAGGEYGNYAIDITRTWPVSGKFSPAQKDLYEAVLRVQRTCVSLCRESASMSLDMLHKVAEEGLKKELQQLGFDMSGEALQTLFPHHVGHYVGLDLHDTPGYPRSNALKARQCITVEPAIYVPDDERWPKHFRGLGIRIEDSVCVRRTGPEVLTTAAVKEVVDIEALR